jgi:NADH-quinone oxidoreductase subunit L
MSKLDILLLVIVSLPLLAVLVTAALGPRVLRGYSHVPTVLALIGSFLCSGLLFLEIEYAQRTRQQGHGAVVQPFDDELVLWTWAAIGEAYAPSGQTPTKISVDESGETPGGTRGLGPPYDGASLPFIIDVTLRADAMTSLMLLMVTFVSSLVAIYSIGYMHGDPGYWRFFTYISLFVFAMCMLVSVSNFLLVYVFWEGVGTCSYLLVGFWYQKPAAAAAGKKAFLVNRIGDISFALAIFLIWLTYGTLNFHDAAGSVMGVLSESRVALGEAGYVDGTIALTICLLLMFAACGKSAQFPLHVWLPDAMEGPTPVSALIHAATMVTAGVYLVARCAPLFMMSPTAQLVVASIGGFTALMAALIALTQFDLKRIPAYSTISQLGYMFLALGCGTYAGISAGMFHMLTHAFFKALLFLGAGSVMHAMGGVIDMRQFGGLRKKLWITCLTFAVGCIALAGWFPLAGFWSKDSILAAVLERGHDHHLPFASFYTVLFWSGVVTAGLTAFYTFRAFFLTFFGEEKIPAEAGHHAHESPPVMWIPLAILALFAAIGGVFGMLYAPEASDYLVHVPSLANALVPRSVAHHGHFFVALVSTLAAGLGTALAAYMYLVPAGAEAHRGRWEIEGLSYLLRFAWLQRFTHMPWAQWLASRPLVRGVHGAASAIGLGWLMALIGYGLLLAVGLLLSPLLLGYYISPYNLSVNKFYFDPIYDVLAVRPLKLLAWLCDVADRWLIDGLVNFIGWLPRAAGSLLRSLQMGLVPFYALAMVLGLVVMLAVRVLWAGI